MRQVAFLLILFFLIFACAWTGANYNDQLQKWVGQTEQTLIARWGKPTSQKIVSNHQKVLTYIKENSWYEPVEYFYDTPMWGADDMVYDPFFDEYGFAPYAQIEDTQFEGICQTSFEVIDGVIQSYRWRGNGCE